MIDSANVYFLNSDGGDTLVRLRSAEPLRDERERLEAAFGG